jgi:hypothetical protein
MKKVCKHCGIEKDLTSFYKMKSATDGLQKICKLCTYIVAREYKEKRDMNNSPVKKIKNDTKELSFVGSRKSHYCEMYSAMGRLGYNPEMDIHIQFCEKWGLKVSKSPRKGPKNQFSYQDCQK